MATDSTSYPSFYDSIHVANTTDFPGDVIFTREFCGAGTGDIDNIPPPPPPPFPKLRAHMAVPWLNTVPEFIRILKTIYFVHSVHDVAPDKLVVWVRCYGEEPLDSFIGIYREDGTPAIATSIQEVERVMLSGICDMLLDICRIERVQAMTSGSFMPYIISIRSQ